MPRRIKVLATTKETFGQRLARLRKASGFTQRELADEIGISRRMVAYYEVETDQPPTSLLPLIARALAISADELLGLKPPDRRPKTQDGRMHRRLQQIDRLPVAERRQIVQLIDALVERHRLKDKAASAAS